LFNFFVGLFRRSPAAHFCKLFFTETTSFRASTKKPFTFVSVAKSPRSYSRDPGGSVSPNTGFCQFSPPGSPLRSVVPPTLEGVVAKVGRSHPHRPNVSISFQYVPPPPTASPLRHVFSPLTSFGWNCVLMFSTTTVLPYFWQLVLCNLVSFRTRPPLSWFTCAPLFFGRFHTCCYRPPPQSWPPLKGTGFPRGTLICFLKLDLVLLPRQPPFFGGGPLFILPSKRLALFSHPLTHTPS